jgi:hypothetical protein
VSWWGVAALCAAAYALKAAGYFAAARAQTSAGTAGGPLELLVVPVLAALIAVQTFDGGRELVVDARLPALIVAGVLVWRRAPIIVIVLAAGATAALLRLAGVA